MKYYHNLYLSEELQQKKEEIIDKLENNKNQLNKYLIVITKNAANHLEFFDSILMKQNVFEQSELFVVGVAEGYPGALEVVEKITQEVYDNTKGTDIRQYLLDRQREFEERIV